MELNKAASVVTKVGPWAWWLSWWRSQSPNRQDRFANLAPVAAVVLFLAAIASAFWYLRVEEIERDRHLVHRAGPGDDRLRDVEQHEETKVPTSEDGAVPVADPGEQASRALVVDFVVVVTDVVAAVALPVLTMKLACASEIIAPPTRCPFSPEASISLPAKAPGGFLNTGTSQRRGGNMYGMYFSVSTRSPPTLCAPMAAMIHW